MGPRNASINKGKNAYKTNVLQNISNRNNTKIPQRLLMWTLTKGVSNKYLVLPTYLGGLLSHLWLGLHQQPLRDFELFLNFNSIRRFFLLEFFLRKAREGQWILFESVPESGSQTRQATSPHRILCLMKKNISVRTWIQNHPCLSEIQRRASHAAPWVALVAFGCLQTRGRHHERIVTLFKSTASLSLSAGEDSQTRNLLKNSFPTGFCESDFDKFYLAISKEKCLVDRTHFFASTLCFLSRQICLSFFIPCFFLSHWRVFRQKGKKHPAKRATEKQGKRKEMDFFRLCFDR